MYIASVVQLDRTADFYSVGWGFESLPGHQFKGGLIMNEIVKHLAMVADPDYDGDLSDCIVGNDAINRFAEAIIEECVRVGAIAFYGNNSTVPVFPADKIKAHFGVR